MLKRSTYPSIKALIISAIIISLTACSSGTENKQSSSDSTPSTEAPSSNASPVATAPASSVGEVPQPEEVKFQESGTDSTSGFIDVVNDSTNLKQTITKTQPIVMQGWAVSADRQQPADMVLITSKDDKTIISTAKVDTERPDVAKELKQPSTTISGWNVQIDPATLPSDNVVLQAWAYDSETKQAYPLNNTPEITRQ